MYEKCPRKSDLGVGTALLILVVELVWFLLDPECEILANVLSPEDFSDSSSSSDLIVENDYAQDLRFVSMLITTTALGCCAGCSTCVFDGSKHRGFAVFGDAGDQCRAASGPIAGDVAGLTLLAKVGIWFQCVLIVISCAVGCVGLAS
jgi:hypothetical protein